MSGPKADLSKIEFIALHYPGVKPGALKLDQPMQVMLNTDIFYRSKQPVGYSFGYNFAVFPSCRVEGRGFDIRNAANVANADGIEDNSRSLAMNIMVNGVDGATPVQAQYARDMVDDIWAHLGRQVPLVPHGHIPGAATPCPGAGLLAQCPLVSGPRSKRSLLFLPLLPRMEMSRCSRTAKPAPSKASRTDRAKSSGSSTTSASPDTSPVTAKCWLVVGTRRRSVSRTRRSTNSELESCGRL